MFVEKCFKKLVQKTNLNLEVNLLLPKSFCVLSLSMNFPFLKVKKHQEKPAGDVHIAQFTRPNGPNAFNGKPKLSESKPRTCFDLKIS